MVWLHRSLNPTGRMWVANPQGFGSRLGLGRVGAQGGKASKVLHKVVQNLKMMSFREGKPTSFVALCGIGWDGLERSTNLLDDGMVRI